MKIMLIGLPGCGKSTQANLLSDKLMFPAFSLRDFVSKELSEKSSIGDEIEKSLANNVILPDNIAIRLVLNNLSGKDKWVLDGFPRTSVQSKIAWMARYAIWIDISFDESVNRMALRARENLQEIERRIQIERGRFPKLIQSVPNVIRIDGMQSQLKVFEDIKDAISF